MFVNLVEKYGLVPKSVYPESYSSSASRDMNAVLRYKLRQYASELRDAYTKDKLSVEELTKKKDECMKEVYRILSLFLGVPPTK